jgi:hypothetical protein
MAKLKGNILEKEQAFPVFLFVSIPLSRRLALAQREKEDSERGNDGLQWLSGGKGR